MTTAAETAPPTFREIVTDALRYWEPRRLVYNGVLAIIVIGWLATHFNFKVLSTLRIDAPLVLGFFLLAIVANLLYCAAYIADVFVQLSGFRAQWLRFRWVLFLLGTAVASTLAWLCLNTPFYQPFPW